MIRKELVRLKQLSIETSGLNERLQYLYEKATNTTAILNGLPMGSSLRSKIEEAVVSIHAEIIDQHRKLEELYSLREKLRREIEPLPRTERYVLAYRYVDGQSYKAISRLMHLSIDYIFQLHRRALKKILIECS